MIFFKVKNRKPALLSWCILSLFAAISGCTDKTSEQQIISESVYSKQYRQKSAIVIVSLSETNISTAGTIQLMLDIHARANTEVVVPEIEPCIEPFTVANHYAEPVQTLPSGKLLHRRVWTLFPSLPGAYSFQPLEVLAGSTSIKTAPVQVGVTSLLSPNIEHFEIKDIAASVDLLPEEKQHNQRWLVLSGIVGIGFILRIIVRLTRRPKKTVLLSPAETAFQAMENLPQDELQRIQALTAILLVFIEGRLNVPTTGKTISEIIPHLPKDILLGRREPLETILTTSEQIRFSNKIPFGFSVELQEYVRSFVETMKEVPCD